MSASRSAAAHMATYEPMTVVLKGGVSVSLAAMRLAWQLEERGFLLSLDADNALLVHPRDRLTDGDRAEIREWLDELKRIVLYDPQRYGVIV